MESGQENPRLREDMQLKLVEGGPVDYAYRTDKPVEFVTVANEASGVLGYIWASDEDDAAGWVERPAVLVEASNSGSYWLRKLREAKARSLTPSQALAELAEDRPGGRIGAIVPGSRSRADTVIALEEKAREGWQPPAPSTTARRGRS
ncbi:hypothetical protein [Streptomyces sp. NRRL S-495]|uniref:hypothetical protein n=1 Tax=Streptomyces sp. NRRL S-495 TaxID=1609133 RepID=UPI0013319F7C|nr:hypothetical protein [Streptomyces sp. NRRL S-495]